MSPLNQNSTMFLMILFLTGAIVGVVLTLLAVIVFDAVAELQPPEPSVSRPTNCWRMSEIY